MHPCHFFLHSKGVLEIGHPVIFLFCQCIYQMWLHYNIPVKLSHTKCACFISLIMDMCRLFFNKCQKLGQCKVFWTFGVQWLIFGLFLCQIPLPSLQAKTRNWELHWRRTAWVEGPSYLACVEESQSSLRSALSHYCWKVCGLHPTRTF